jgi:hypothetical protein
MSTKRSTKPLKTIKNGLFFIAIYRRFWYNKYRKTALYRCFLVLPCGRSPQRGENGVQEAGGSNPLTQTKDEKTLILSGFSRLLCLHGERLVSIKF